MKKVIFTYDSKDMKHGQNGEIGEASALYSGGRRAGKRNPRRIQ